VGQDAATAVPAERMREIFESVKSWGRWGPDDQAGALNLLTPQTRLAAAAGVRHGLAVSCARELPVDPSPENPRPALHLMVRAGDDCVAPGLGLESTGDFVGVAFHGMATSHIDALCHVFVDGQMYNGFPAADVKSTGAVHGSIMCAADGIVGRGVLLDIPRLRGVAHLEPGTAILPDELSAAEAAQGVTVGQGDILLVATGRDARRAASGPWAPMADGLAGLHAECLPWLRERDIAVLGCDGVSDVLPANPAPGWPMPVHQCALVAMGVHLLDNLRLDRLSAACSDHGQWSFLFTVAPLLVAGGTGSPANPIAVL
jgi:kynurenine formamidase